MTEHNQLLQEAVAAMNPGVTLTDAQIEQFAQYTRLLLEWNEKMNLTAITDERDIVLKHYADSLTALSVPALDPLKPLRIADIGTGAGFPGLPLQIAAPQWRVTLMDALQKRVKFLAHTTAELGLDTVECLHLRAEDAGKSPNHREQYDAVISRAVARLQVLAEYALPLVKQGGLFVALKGPAADEEIAAAETAIFRLGGAKAEIQQVTIPFTDLQHKLVIIKKTRPTPKAYPRNAAQITKAPLGSA